MDPLLSALVSAGLLDGDAAEAIARLLDPVAQRQYAEGLLRNAIYNAMQEQQRRVLMLIASSEGQVTAVQWDTFWATERGAMFNSVLPAMTAIAAEGLASAVLQGGDAVNWQEVHTQVVDWVRAYYMDPNAGSFGSIPNLDAVSRQQFGEMFTQWQTGTLPQVGYRQGLPDLIRAIEPVFGAERAERIAATETTRIYAQVTQQMADGNPAVSVLRWYTASDELVCFPAGVMVSMADGEKPIKAVRVGDYVRTRSGLRQVVATSRRPYSGSMTTVQWKGGGVTATSDHPFWTLQKGWLQCGQLSSADALQSLDNQPVQVLDVFNFNVGYTADTPAVGFKIPGLANILGRVGVPVDAINFKGDTQFGKQEVDAVPTDRGLLNVGDTGSIKSLAHLGFKHVFAPESAAARHAAKLAVAQRLYANLYAAGAALLDNRWAATFLRTVMPIEALFGYKQLAAAFAGNVLGCSSTALARADCIPVCHDSGNLKGLAAYRANLRNEFDGSGCVVALPATELATLGELLSSDRIAALLAVDGLRSTRFVVALGRAIDLVFSSGLVFLAATWARLNHRNGPFDMSRLLIELYHKPSIDVYDIQVEEDAEFYANGVLVHNCPICGPLHGATRPKGQPYYLHPTLGQIRLPAHVRCRCWEGLETDATMEIPFESQWRFAGD